MIINPISGKSQLFIGEIKTMSPFNFKSPYSFNELMNLCIDDSRIDWISVHTGAIFGGDLESISYVQNFANKPILAKGIHGTDKFLRETINRGAEYALIVNRVPDFNEIDLQRCLFEMDIDFARDIAADYSKNNLKFVWNARDLKTGHFKPIEQLKPFLELENAWICQASGIKNIDNIHPDVSSFIVGENLVDFVKSLN
jgi:indole-3-glycerol phosphate synthase